MQFIRSIKDGFYYMIMDLKRYRLVIIVLVIYLSIFELLLPAHSNCYVKNLFGIPCPVCGMTRAFKALLKLDIAKSFYWHPLWPLVIIISVMYFFHHTAIVKKIMAKRIIIVILVLIIFGTYFVRLFLYQGNKPLDFDKPFYLKL